MTNLKQELRKYFIMGSQNCRRDPVKILEEAIQGGITAFQFREKGTGSLTGISKIKLGEQLRDICRSYNVPFFINDDIDLVDRLDVDGIHVGQGDMPIEEIKKLFPNKMIGLSVSNSEELTHSPLELVDYVGAGSVFTTLTKEDAKKAVGLEWVKTLRSQFPLLPIVGIGGITTDNANKVLEAGADGIAVISEITEAEDIKDVIGKL